MSNRPGGELATRPLHFIWICDCSGSMFGEKINSLNHAIRDVIPEMKDVSADNPNATVLIRALKFSSGAQWMNKDPIPVENYTWVDLDAEGVTDMGKALSMVADEMKIPPMTERALPPVLVLISDGQPTDNFDNGLKELLDERWGQRAVRIAIAIGNDADNDVLQKFIGNNEMKPLVATNATMLVRQIKWVSTVVLKAASQPMSQSKDAQKPTTNVPIPQAPDNITNSGTDGNDVW